MQNENSARCVRDLPRAACKILESGAHVRYAVTKKHACFRISVQEVNVSSHSYDKRRAVISFNNSISSSFSGARPTLLRRGATLTRSFQGSIRELRRELARGRCSCLDGDIKGVYEANNNHVVDRIDPEPGAV